MQSELESVRRVLGRWCCWGHTGLGAAPAAAWALRGSKWAMLGILCRLEDPGHRAGSGILSLLLNSPALLGSGPTLTALPVLSSSSYPGLLSAVPLCAGPFPPGDFPGNGLALLSSPLLGGLSPAGTPVPPLFRGRQPPLSSSWRMTDLSVWPFHAQCLAQTACRLTVDSGMGGPPGGRTSSGYCSGRRQVAILVRSGVQWPDGTCPVGARPARLAEQVWH